MTKRLADISLALLLGAAALPVVAGLAVGDLGEAGGDRLEVEGLVDLALADVLEAWRSALPTAVGV